MKLSMPLFFSLMGCLLYTGSLQAQLVPELEDSLQGSVKSIQIEQAILVRHLGQWAEGKRQKIEATTYDQHGRKTQHLQYETDGSLKKKTVYTYPTENTTEQRVYSHDSLPADRTLLITDRQEQRITQTLYTADGSLQRKTVSVLDGQDRILEETEYNAAGRLFRRLVHTYGSKGHRLATARYGAHDVFAGPVGKSEYAYTDQGQLSQSHDYGSDGLLIQKWGYADEQDEQGNWTKRTVSRWVQKFGKAYFEPMRVTYRTIVYYPEEAEETEDSTAPPETAASVTSPAQ